jgi:hypothetical protein
VRGWFDKNWTLHPHNGRQGTDQAYRKKVVAVLSMGLKGYVCLIARTFSLKPRFEKGVGCRWKAGESVK